MRRFESTTLGNPPSIPICGEMMRLLGQMMRLVGQMIRLLGLTACHFEYGAAGLGQPARLRHDGAVVWKHEVWDVESKGLPTEVEIELIVETAGRLKGRYMMHAAPNSRPSPTQRLVAVTLANQVGAALG